MRISLENEIKNRLGKINSSIQEKIDFLDNVKLKNTDFLNFVNESMKNGIRASELQSIEHNKEFYLNQIVEIEFELRNLLIKREEIQNELIDANKQRKVMEKLKEKELEKYKELEALEEAKVVDQIVTYNSTRKRGE